MCLANDLGNVVHTKVTKVAVEFHKAQMISALVLLILTSNNNAECVAAIVSNEIVVVEVFLEDDASRSLRSFIRPEYSPIAKPATLLMIVRHVSLLRLYLEHN